MQRQTSAEPISLRRTDIIQTTASYSRAWCLLRPLSSLTLFGSLQHASDPFNQIPASAKNTCQPDHYRPQGHVLIPPPIAKSAFPPTHFEPRSQAHSKPRPYEKRRGRAHHHQVVLYLFREPSYLPQKPRVQHAHVVRRHERVLFCRHLFRTATLRALLIGYCVIAPADSKSHGDAFVYSDTHMNGIRPTEVHEGSQQGRSWVVYLAIEVCKVWLQIFFRGVSPELSNPETFDALPDNLLR